MTAGPDAKTAEDEEDSSVLPPLAKGDELTLRELKPEQKFTQPPPRYTEATLVKALEENGIGRPSTYASIITVIQAREYVNKIEGKFKPTFLGAMLVQKLLSPAFDDILDVNYTRELEEESRQDRVGRVQLPEDADQLLQEVPEGLEARREGHAQHERGV
jgi:DNA topoisomerase-1